MDYLKKERVRIERLAEDVEVIEMSALCESKLIKCDNVYEQLATWVKHCTTNYADLDVETILATMPREALQEISDHIARISGMEDLTEDDLAGNSERTLDADSSFA